METLIRRYLDGELDDEECRCFLDELENNPELDRRVAALEQVSGLGSRRDPVAVSDGFTDRVMEEVGAQDRTAPRASSRAAGSGRFARSLPMAASWLLALGLGYVLARGLPGAGVDSGVTDGSLPPVKVVRLAYTPRTDAVSRVEVAGSFNGWNPARNPMRQEDGHWVTTLVLPPDTYEYMFVVDGASWVTDPLAPTTRDDGFGSRNAVLELEI